MRITRHPSLTEPEFQGCISAFVDSLFGQLNGATMYIRKLAGQAKGAAFAYEMSLDNHRYGALVVLDRWAELIHSFGPHAAFCREIIDGAPGKVQTAENILGRANQLIDAAPRYSSAIVEASVLAFQSLQTTFQDERRSAERSDRLGPMLSDEFRNVRRIFLEDLVVK